MSSPRVLALKAKLRRDGFIEVKLHGRCMEPFLVAGDTARISPVETVEVGDICLVELESGELALHRIVSMRDDYVLTKGDYSGLAEKRQVEHVFGRARAFRFRDTDRWVDFSPSKAAKRRSAWLSRIIIRKTETHSMMVGRKLHRKMIYFIGLTRRKVKRGKTSRI